MKKFILAISLALPLRLMGTLCTMDRLRTLGLNDLETAEYLMDTYPNLSPQQHDLVWLLMRNGCRNTLAHYRVIEQKYGTPSPHNALDIIRAQIGPKIEWARVFNKAVARGIRPVLDSELYTQYVKHRAYQDSVDQTLSNNDAVDPE